jgi:hypothetical protein
MWRGGRVAEGGGLLNRYTGKTVSEVQILSSPPLLLGPYRTDRLQIIPET